MSAARHTTPIMGHRWHPGEVAVQDRLGATDVASRIVRSIHPELPQVAATFLRDQPMLVVGAADPGGSLWASILVGPPGFIRPTRRTSVDVRALPASGDPLRAVLSEGDAPVGTIAIELSSRRRIRLNGRSRPSTSGGNHRGLTIDLEEVFSNCPKYISARTVSAAPDAPAGQARRSADLTDADVSLIRGADTFFIATSDSDGGVDASHRGGQPGFVHVDGREITFGDYTGNSMYITLGNLEVQPRAGLLFIDFATGDTLQVTGTAAVDFDPAHVTTGGALRMIHLSVDEVVRQPGATGLAWGPAEASRFSPDPAAIGGTIDP